MPAKSTFGSASVIPYTTSNPVYGVSRSLRFNSADSTYLSRTPSSAGNRKTWTWSGWVKRTKNDSVGNLFSNSNGASGFSAIRLETANTLGVFDWTGSAMVWYLNTNQVFRDPSAWYHIVVAIDTTQATASNRVKIYINGSEVTSFSTATYPTQNLDTYTNSTQQAAIGSTRTTGNSEFFDGYLTEINFIDGQALTPDSFGYTDPNTGVWQLKKYTGTYGTNGFYLPFTNQGNTQNYFTYSEDFSNVFWTKYQSTCVTNATTAPNGTNTADKMVINNGQIGGQFYTTGGGLADNTILTSSVYLKALDFTTGYLYIQKKDGGFAYIGFDLATGNVTEGINGAIGGTITSVGDGWYRVTCTSSIGTGAGTTINVNFAFNGTGDGVKGSYIWGAQLEQGSSAGPYMYTLASTQAQTLALGEDRSLPAGGYNNWAASAFSVTPGSGNDSLLDSPTDYGNDTGLGGEVGSNYATFNSVDLGGSTLTNGNLDISSGANQYRYSTMPVPQTGKWYFEFTVNSLGASNTGFWIVLPTLGGVFGLPASGAYRILKDASDISITGSGTPAAGHTMKVAYDADNKRIWFGRDTLWFSNAGNTTSDPSAGTNPSFSNLTSTNNDSIYVNQTGGGAATCTGSINFGQRPFAYAAPTGFKTLCTANMPTPKIKKPKSAFDAITYNGTGTTFVSPSGLAFAPDLVWVKSRSQDISHVLSDTVRGTGEVLCSNNTRAGSPDSFLTNFNQNGFTLNTSITGNNSGSTYVAWCWKGGGPSSTNTAGSITSQVSVDPQTGFSIVSYTGTGANGSTIGHGLGVAPKMIIAKRRTGTEHWYVGHSSIGWSNQLILNLTLGSGGSGIWFLTQPTSSVFYVGGTGNSINESGQTAIAYCFSEIEGYSKFGSYTGNGLADGPFVWCGFRPKFLLIKNTSAVSQWEIIDSTRDTYNPAGFELYPNATTVEANAASSGGDFDFLSSGFKSRRATTELNSSGATHIFAAFAESPFKYARAR